MRENTIPIATIDFNDSDVETEEVGEILSRIRDIEGIIVFEQGYKETYTVARKED